MWLLYFSRCVVLCRLVLTIDGNALTFSYVNHYICVALCYVVLCFVILCGCCVMLFYVVLCGTVVLCWLLLINYNNALSSFM